MRTYLGALWLHTSGSRRPCGKRTSRYARQSSAYARVLRKLFQPMRHDQTRWSAGACVEPLLIYSSQGAPQDNTQPDEHFLEMPTTVFRRTMEKQIGKSFQTLKDRACSRPPQVQVQEALTDPPLSLASILGMC